MLTSVCRNVYSTMPSTMSTTLPTSCTRNLSTTRPTFSGAGSTKLWGGRFAKDTDSSVVSWCDARPIDNNLVVEDLWGSMAHVTMLGSQGIVKADVAGEIISTLKGFQDDYIAGKLNLFDEKYKNHDDVHMNMEARLIDAIGADKGGRMHTTRSRNDQVILDSKLYARRRILELRTSLVKAVQAFLDRAKNHTSDVMVGYTHVQHAQPISVAYWLSHYAAILLRDLERLKRAYDVTDENPLGSGALAGTSFPINRNLTTKLLGFQKVMPHGLDATSSRDFMLESLSAVSILETTLSRLAEELILWSSYEFKTVTLDDGFAMGSSMMPQKKNPGSIELLRGRSGRINGLLSAGLTMMKGLPSGYNRDFHEDKEILVETFDLINHAVAFIPQLVKTTQLNLERMNELSYGNFSTATEVANFLVARHNVPFRQAHHIVGSLVGELSRSGRNFSAWDFCIDHITKKHNVPVVPEEIKKVFDPKTVMLSYKSLGGTGKEPVEGMLRQFNKQLQNHQKVLAEDQKRVNEALEVTRNISTKAKGVQTVEQLKALIPKEYNVSEVEL